MRLTRALAPVAFVALLVGCGGETERSATVVQSSEGASSSAAAGDAGSASDAGSEPEESSATTAPEAGPVGPKDTLASPFIQGTARVEFDPGDPDALSVVAVGPLDPDSSTIPVVVRNNTPSTLYQLEATGRLLDTAGQLIGSGSSQGFEPAALEPGYIGIGYIYMDAEKPPDATVEVTAAGDTDGTFAGSVSLEIGQANVVPGDLGNQIVGDVTNTTDSEVSGPVGVTVMCFDDTGAPIDVKIGYTDGDAPVAPGATVSYSVDLFDDPCPTFLIGASGYDF